MKESASAMNARASQNVFTNDSPMVLG